MNDRNQKLEELRKTRSERYSAYREVPKEEERPADFFGTLRRFMKLLSLRKASMANVLFTCFLSMLCNILGPTYIGRAIDVLNEQVKLKLAGNAISPKTLIPYIIVLAVLYGGMALFLYIQEYTMAGVTADIVKNLRESINNKLSHLPLRYFDKNGNGEILSRIMNDVDNISNTLQNNLAVILGSVMLIIGVFVMMLITNWFLTLVVLILVPASAFAAFKILHISRKLFRSQWDRLGELNGHVEEMYTGHKIVRTFGQEELAKDEFAEINNDLTDVTFRAQFISGTVHPFINLMDNIGYILIAVIGGYLIVNNGVFSVGGAVLYDMGKSFSIGGILTFITYSKLFTSPMSSIAQIVNNIQSCMASAERVFALLDEPTENKDRLRPLPASFEQELKFEDVSFCYTADKPLIEHMDLTVRAGELVALVGPTGAGKTTFVNLLMRFYDVNEGRITIDGTDIRDISREELRALFGMVLQDTWLFGGTVLENLRYGKLDATDEEVRAAARAAHADEFIESLPDGYMTRLDENGANLSQGQRQMITIARALLKDPKILILDEATSSVDTRTELFVQQAMSEIMKGRTNFVIAHRLSTIRSADEILYIDNGTVKERGTHEELLKKGGLYAEMYYSQFGKKMPDLSKNNL